MIFEPIHIVALSAFAGWTVAACTAFFMNREIKMIILEHKNATRFLEGKLADLASEVRLRDAQLASLNRLARTHISPSARPDRTKALGAKWSVTPRPAEPAPDTNDRSDFTPNGIAMAAPIVAAVVPSLIAEESVEPIAPNEYDGPDLSPPPVASPIVASPIESGWIVITNLPPPSDPVSAPEISFDVGSSN